MIDDRFKVLDGWRAISILAVLACHLLPLGPKAMHLNYDAGLFGMSLFFTLSGFLVTRLLLHRDDVVDFLIRRFFRILPLAWLYMVITLWLYSADISAWLAHLLFYANYPPKPLVPHVTEHLWSLCVEMHFYIGIAILVALLKKRGLLLIPLICVGITLLRVSQDAHVSVITHLRIDEILVGGFLALIYERKLGESIFNFVRKQNFLLMLVLLIISCHPRGEALMYLRPYFAALLIGTTLLNPETKVSQLLNHKVLFYIASISFALYIIHPLLASTWLGSGEGWDKYMKRPLLFAVLFFLAHVSTFYFEKRCIAFGKNLSNFINVRFNREQ